MLAALLVAPVADAAPGDPDPNFGAFGQVLLPLQAGDDLVARSELGFDQKLLLTGRRVVSGDTDLLVVRLDPDGTLDEGFGAGGVVLTDVANRNDAGEGVTLDPFGYVLVAGWVETAGSPNAVVVRYTGAGAPDPSFGGTGVVLTDVGGADDRAYAVVARPDARVLIAGQSGGNLLLAQFDDLGVPDPTFGSSGVATPNPTAGIDRAWAAALQTDGKLVIAGEASGDVLVARFLTTGAPDPAFGTGGFVVRDAGGVDVAHDVRIRSDGAVVVAGSTTAGPGGDGFVLALNATGAGLGGFGSNGLVLSGLTGADAFVAVDLTAAGDVVVAGRVAGAMDEDVLVARLSSAGILDPGFGLGGTATRDFGSGDDRAVGMAVERSGRVVVGAAVANGAIQDAGAVRVLGDPPGEGEEFQVNTYTTDEQGEPRVAVDGSGRFVVVWSSYGAPSGDPLDFGIRGQRYEADGDPGGAEFQVNAYTTNYQVAPAVAADAAGNFIVVWQSDGSPGSDQSGSSIVGRRFAANGAPLGPEFQVNTHTTGNQVYPRVAANAAGDFVVVWESDTSAADASLTSVQGRFFASDGTPITPTDLQLNEITIGEQRTPVVAMSGADVVVAWDTDVSAGDDDSPSSVAARRFSSAGVPADAEFQVNVYTTGVQAFPDVAMGSDGRFVVTWHGDGPDDVALTGFGAFARRYTPAGVPIGGQFTVNEQTAGEQWFTGAGFDTDQSFLVTWHGSGVGDAFGVFGRRFAADGTASGTSFRVNRDVEDAQRFAALGQGVGGAFVVAWETFSYAESDRSGAAIAAARFDGQTVFTTTSTLPGGTTTSTTLGGGTTTTTSTTVPGSSTSTTMGGGTTTTTSTTLPGGTTTTSTTLPGGTTTTSTTLPGGTTTTTSLPGGTTTTSTTVPGGTTTTTTLPGPPGSPLMGTKLIVKVKPGDPSRTLVKAIAKDPAVSLGAGNGSLDDPVAYGGGLRVAVEGAFDGDFDVPGERWKYLKKEGQNRGYKAKKADPARSIVLKPGKLLKVVAKGSALGVDLASEPAAIEIVVRLGSHRHCMRFVGTKKFAPGRKLVSISGVRPSACLP